MDQNYLAENDLEEGVNSYVIHIRVQQRKGNKYITIIEGIPDEYDIKKMLRAWKKNLNCNGTIVEEKGVDVVQLTGDQRASIGKFFEEEGIAKKENIKIHGA